MSECDCINGCEKCETPFQPENVIRYQPWIETGITDAVVAASDYDKLLSRYRKLVTDLPMEGEPHV